MTHPDPRVCRQVIAEVVDSSLGRLHREDQVLARTGGPAGNARLTAWLGLTLLALFLGELVTLLDVRGLISWHIAVGLILIPPSVAKTVSTGWRMVRYYLDSEPYVRAGPPPLLLRMLGPLVILGTTSVLASGVLLIGLGPAASFRPWFSVAGHSVSPLTVHQASFILWAVGTGLHVLARLVPAAQLAAGTQRTDRVPGGVARGLTLAVAAVAAAGIAIIVLALSGAWTDGSFQQHRLDRPGQLEGQ